MKENKPLKKMTDKGFYFASEAEARKGIYTYHNADGTTIKQIPLPDSKQTARVRQTNSRDQNEAHRLAENGLQHALAVLSTCTMIANRRVLLSELERLSRNDLTLLLLAYVYLNNEDWKTFIDRMKSEVIDKLISEFKT